MHHHEPECLAKILVCYLKIKVTVRVHIIKIWLMTVSTVSPELRMLLQPNLFDCTSSSATPSCRKIRLLCSESRLQRRFKIIMNVCQGNNFLITDSFVTKVGTVGYDGQICEDWFAIFKAQVTLRALMIKMGLFLAESWRTCILFKDTSRSFQTKHVVLIQNGYPTMYWLPEFVLTNFYTTYVWARFATVFILMPHKYIVHNIVSTLNCSLWLN